MDAEFERRKRVATWSVVIGASIVSILVYLSWRKATKDAEKLEEDAKKAAQATMPSNLEVPPAGATPPSSEYKYYYDGKWYKAGSAGTRFVRGVYLPACPDKFKEIAGQPGYCMRDFYTPDPEPQKTPLYRWEDVYSCDPNFHGDNEHLPLCYLGNNLANRNIRDGWVRRVILKPSAVAKGYFYSRDHDMIAVPEQRILVSAVTCGDQGEHIENNGYFQNKCALKCPKGTVSVAPYYDRCAVEAIEPTADQFVDATLT